MMMAPMGVRLAGLSTKGQPAAMAGAMMEYIIFNCPDCRMQIAAQNQVYLGASSTTSYVLQCVVPLATVDDLKGKRIRAAGAYWARWAEQVGAVPVSMSINETLEGLNQGVVDCTASNTADFVNFGFIDVVEFLSEGAPGSQFPSATAVINKDAWEGASEDQRHPNAHLQFAVRTAVRVHRGVTPPMYDRE